MVYWFIDTFFCVNELNSEKQKTIEAVTDKKEEG